jgi:hypothetical protein
MSEFVSLLPSPGGGLSAIDEVDPPSQPSRQPHPPKGLANRSSYKERDRERQERALKEGREAMAREIAERNGRAGWPY